MIVILALEHIFINLLLKLNVEIFYQLILNQFWMNYELMEDSILQNQKFLYHQVIIQISHLLLINHFPLNLKLFTFRNI